MKYLIVLVFISCSAFSEGLMRSDVLPVGQFSLNNLDSWSEKIFDHQTSYTLTDFEGLTVLKASSHNSASGLFREQTVDIKTYPFLNWRWRVEESLPPLDETQKQGDDYAARIYVIVSGGLFFWRTKALNYVWSSRTEKESVWPNAFALGNAQMIAARTARDPADVWFVEKRNIYEALKQWLGHEVSEVDAIAIMTDTDNSDGKATAFYGDIYFSKE